MDPTTGENEEACKHPPNGAEGATRHTCFFVPGVSNSGLSRGPGTTRRVPSRRASRVSLSAHTSLSLSGLRNDNLSQKKSFSTQTWLERTHRIDGDPAAPQEMEKHQMPGPGGLERGGLEKEILCVSTREEEKRPPLCIQPWAHAARLSNVEEKKVLWEGLWDQFLEKH